MRPWIASSTGPGPNMKRGANSLQRGRQGVFFCLPAAIPSPRGRFEPNLAASRSSVTNCQTIRYESIRTVGTGPALPVGGGLYDKRYLQFTGDLFDPECSFYWGFIILHHAGACNKEEIAAIKVFYSWNGFYHGMDKDLEYQVLGRAQRPGRTCPLNIWHLCYDSEEKTARQTDNRF